MQHDTIFLARRPSKYPNWQSGESAPGRQIGSFGSSAIF